MAKKYKWTKSSETGSNISHSTQNTVDDLIKFEACFTGPEAGPASEDGPTSSCVLPRFSNPSINYANRQQSGSGGGNGETMAFKFAATVFMDRLKAKLRGKEGKNWKPKLWNDVVQLDTSNHQPVLGPKRCYSSLNLMQLPHHACGEPRSSLGTYRSCESSPRRTRPSPYANRICNMKRDDLDDGRWQTCNSKRAAEHMQCHDSEDSPAAAAVKRLCPDSLEVESGTMCPEVRTTLPERYHHDQYRLSCPPQRIQNQQHYPTCSRYYNISDPALSICTAVQKSAAQGSYCNVGGQKGWTAGICIAKHRLSHSLRFNNCDPNSCVPPDFVNGEPHRIEDIPQGLATVLNPNISPDLEFQIQKRAPRGLAAVIVNHHCEGPDQIEELCECQASDSRPQQIFQENNRALVSSPIHNRLITNIDMLEETQFQIPHDCKSTESITSSQTKIRMETEVREQQRASDSAQLTTTPILDPPCAYSSTDRNSGNFLLLEESPLQTSSNDISIHRRESWGGLQPQLSSKVRAKRGNSATRTSARGNLSGNPNKTQNASNSLYQQEGMSFNQRAQSSQSTYPQDSTDGFSNQMSGSQIYQGSEFPSLALPSGTPKLQEVRPKDNRRISRRHEMRASGSRGTWHGMFLPSATTSTSSGNGTSESSRRSRRHSRSGNKTSIPSTRFTKNNPQQADQLGTQDLENSERHKLNRRTSATAIQSSSSFSQHPDMASHGSSQSTPPAMQGSGTSSSYTDSQNYTPSDESYVTVEAAPTSSNTPAPTVTQSQQDSYAKLMMDAQNSQMLLDEASATLLCKMQSQSRSKSGNGGLDASRALESSVAYVKGMVHGTDMVRSAEESPKGNPTPPILQSSSSKSVDNIWELDRGQSNLVIPNAPVGVTYKDRMISITHLLNSMNSITQLLNTMPVLEEVSEPPPAAVNVHYVEDEAVSYSTPQLVAQASASRMDATSSGWQMPQHSKSLPVMEAEKLFDRTQDNRAYELRHPSLPVQRQFDDIPRQDVQFEMRARSSQIPPQTLEMNSSSIPRQSQMQPNNYLQDVVTQDFSSSSEPPQSQGQQRSFNSSYRQTSLGSSYNGSAQPRGYNASQIHVAGELNDMTRQQLAYSESRNPNNIVVVESQSQLFGNVDRQPSFSSLPTTTIPQQSNEMGLRSSQSYMPQVQSQYQVGDSTSQQSSTYGNRASMFLPQQYDPGMDGTVPPNSTAMQTPESMPDQQYEMMSGEAFQSSSNLPNEIQMEGWRSQAFAQQGEASMMQRYSRSLEQFPVAEFDPQQRYGTSVPWVGTVAEDPLLLREESPYYSSTQTPPYGQSDQSQEQLVYGTPPSETITQWTSQRNSATQLPNYGPQQAQGMTANYQPMSKFQTLGQIPPWLQSHDNTVKRSSKKSISPVLSTIPQQFEVDGKILASAQNLTVSVGGQPSEVDGNHLVEVPYCISQYSELVKPQTTVRKSLSNTVDTMLQELEILELRNRQNSMAYSMKSLPTHTRVLE